MMRAKRRCTCNKDPIIKSMVLGNTEHEGVADTSMVDLAAATVDGEYKVSVLEKKHGRYDCPALKLSAKAKLRIQKPWRKGLIVKLLGRKIGYRALENRLNQLWVKNGVIHIIDLGQDYNLVTFSNDEDRDKALANGPWLIYDHYLTLREWSRNFHPESASISRVAVWVRFSGLPIEYYDARTLHAIGDRIGKTIKVDKNTLKTERGKYARICVEVDLKNPLLAMFEINNRIYKIEYEGLHLLCMQCGKFGHYKGRVY